MQKEDTEDTNKSDNPKIIFLKKMIACQECGGRTYQFKDGLQTSLCLPPPPQVVYIYLYFGKL